MDSLFEVAQHRVEVDETPKMEQYAAASEGYPSVCCWTDMISSVPPYMLHPNLP